MKLNTGHWWVGGLLHLVQVARRLSACLFVRPYVARRYCVRTIKYILKVFFHHRVATPFYDKPRLPTVGASVFLF